MQDYDRYPEVYAPEVRASAIREREGNRFHVYLRLYTRKVLTWVADTEHSVEFVPVGDTRMHVPSRPPTVPNEHSVQVRTRSGIGSSFAFSWALPM